MLARQTAPPITPTNRAVTGQPWQNLPGERLEYRPPTIAGTVFLFEVDPFKSLPFVDRGSGELEETAEDRWLGVVDVESPLDEEVDDRFSVTGIFPTVSGSRPTFWAATTSKLPSSCVKSGVILDRGAGITHCEIDEGPSGDSRNGWDVKWVSDRT